MKFRIKKSVYYDAHGKAIVRYIPQYKGLFFWNNFEEWHGTCPLSVSCNTEEEAQTYIDSYIKNKSETADTIVKEFEVDL